MSSLLTAIDIWEKENDFQITPYIQSKSGFDLIKGLAQAFGAYKTEIATIQTAYTDFFIGKRFDKIEPEYNRVLYNVNWFLGIFGKVKKHFAPTFSAAEKNEADDMYLDIAETQAFCIQFSSTHMENFQAYIYYFIKLEEYGFNMSEDEENENYISFPEYFRNKDIIEQRDYEQFKAQIRADRISGKY